MKKKEFRLLNKDGEIIYKYGTKYEAAAYALENQLLIMADEDIDIMRGEG